MVNSFRHFVLLIAFWIYTASNLVWRRG